MFQFADVTEDICKTTVYNVCQTSTEEECVVETAMVCKTVEETECKTWMVKECRWINQKICHDELQGSQYRRTWTKNSLHKILTPIANIFKPILDPIGKLLNQNTQKKCRIIPKKWCQEVPRKYCQPISKQICDPEPRSDCKQVLSS